MNPNRVHENQFDSDKHFKVLTWSLQGVQNNGKSTFEQINEFLRYEYQVIALQESGSAPHPSQANIEDITSRFNLTNPDNVCFPVESHQWYFGTDSRPILVYQYFLNTDLISHRVNLSIVSVMEADEVIVLNAPGSIRPSLGIRIGDAYFFNIHANEGETKNTAGSNSAAMVNRIYNLMKHRNNESWILLGNFNRNPDVLMEDLQRDFPETANDVQTLHQIDKTHLSGGNLDYAVVQNNLIKSTLLVQRLLICNFLRSDHCPVHINLSFSLTSSIYTVLKQGDESRKRNISKVNTDSSSNNNEATGTVAVVSSTSNSMDKVMILAEAAATYAVGFLFDKLTKITGS